MSGPSTLRICLAAMAPALTEAASARLRPQENADTSTNKKTFKTNYGPDSTNTSRTHSVVSNDTRALGGRKRSIGEGRATHLTLVDSYEQLDPLLDSQVPPIRRESTNSQSCAKSDKSRVNAFRGLTFSKIGIVHKNSVGSPLYVSEDFQESCPLPKTASTLLHKLKIMNKPETGALDSENIQIKNTSHILKSNQQNASVSKNSEPGSISSMVNGNGDIDKKTEAEDGGKESGDVPSRKKVPTPQNRRSVHFNDSDNYCDELKIQGKMGLPCTLKDKEPYDTNCDMPLAIGSPQLQAMEILDLKSRDESRRECVRKQAYLERKVETLLRRLKRMRGKAVETHSREQLCQFVNYQHRSLQQVAKVMRSEAPGPAELKEHFLSNDEVKSMSTTELVKLVKTYQPMASSRNQHRHPSQHLSEHRGISSSLARFGGPSGSVGPVMVIEPGLRSQVAEVSERLCHRVTTVSAELDSDATASSSGGESGDEEGDMATKTKVTSASGMPPLFKRAEWRWASDRAAIVSRWTWLQAQVSDLEYRIRQQSQVHRQLRASKGGVVLGDPPSTTDILRHLQGMAPSDSQVNKSELEGDCRENNQTLLDENKEGGLEVSPFNIQAVMSNVDKQASRLSQSLGNCLSPASSKSSVSAPPSVIGSPLVHSSTSSPGRSPAQTGGRDSVVGDHLRDLGNGNDEDGCPLVPSELSLASQTSDLLKTPELQRQQPNRVQLPSLLSSSSSSYAGHLDTTCQSARCRPLRSYRKRRILRTVGLHRHSQKAARLSDVRCRCSPPANPCPMCGGRQNNTIPMDTESMALRERIALVNASFHPILSFPEDIPLSIHCEGMLKSGLWQDKPSNKRYRGSHKPLHYRESLMLSKDFHLNNNKNHQNIKNNTNNNHQQHQDSVLTFMSGEAGQCGPKKKKVRKNVSIGRDSQNVKNNATSVPSTASVIKNFSEKIKNKYDSKTKSKGATTKVKVKVLPPRPNKSKRKSSKSAKDALKKRREAREEEEDLEALYLEQEFGDIDGDNGGGNLSASASQSSLRDLGHQQIRSYRRKVDNSYDINNIVIPLSMATSMPVEQPQYKEIVTPKWREAPLQALSPASVAAVVARDSLTYKLEKTNGVTKPAESQKPPELNSTLETNEEKSHQEVKEKPNDKATEEVEEDLSDETFALRHLKLELEEKKRFRNFVQYPPLRRSRARSDVSLSALDSRDAGLSEENSLSSRPTTPILMKSLPSGSSGSTGLEESLASLQSQRPRTMSVSTPTSRRDMRQCSQSGFDVMDSSRDAMLEPWPRRFFPLPNEEFERMLEEAPSDSKASTHQHETRYVCSSTAKPSLKIKDFSVKEVQQDTVRAAETLLDSMTSVGDSVALSPQSVSASASSAADDDAADPEWVGGGDNSTSSGSSCKRRSRQILDDPNDPEWLGSDTPRKNKNKR